MGIPQPRPSDQIPDKIYYSISEVSEYTGVEPHVLRYWETKFSRLSPKRVGGNQRKYTRHDLELLYEIIHLLYQEGYTLDGAEKKLRSGLSAVRAEREITEKILQRRNGVAEEDDAQVDIPSPEVDVEPAINSQPEFDFQQSHLPGIPKDEIKLIRNEVADILRTLV